MSEREEAVRAALEPVLAALGLEVFDVTLTGQGRGRVLRVALDRDGGVDLDAITAATDAASAVLDHDDTLVSGPYALELTSPGVERPLRHPHHFVRAVGEVVTVKTHGGDAPARRVRGVLVAADDDPSGGLVLEVEGGDREQLAYDAVDSARTVFEWGPSPRPGGGKNTRHKKKRSRGPAATNVRQPR